MIKVIKQIILSIAPPILIKWYRSIKRALLSKKEYTKFHFNSKKPIVLVCKDANDFPFIDLLKKFNIRYISDLKAKKRRINFIHQDCNIVSFDKNCIFFCFQDFNNNYLRSNITNFNNLLLICCNSFSSLNLCCDINLNNTIYVPNKTESNDFTSCFSSSDNEREYYFLRLMLYLGIITFNKFFDFTKNSLSIKSNKICMSLPESINRRNSFKKMNKFDNYVFYPCLLNKIGWLGCAMSYKSVAMHCINLNYSHFVICEDDAIFKNEYYTNINDLINLTNQFDIDLINTYPTWTDNNIEEKNNYAYKVNDVYVAKRKCSTGAVLNIYSKKFLKMISNYKIVNKRLRYAKYQMDQYTKNSSEKFNIFVTSPYLIDHNIELNSTINKRKNSELIYNLDASLHEVFLQYLIRDKYEIKK